MSPTSATKRSIVLLSTASGWIRLREADDRRAQVALSDIRKTIISGEATEDGLQCCRDGRLGKGMGLHSFARSVGQPGSGMDSGGQGVTFGNSINR